MIYSHEITASALVAIARTTSTIILLDVYSRMDVKLDCLPPYCRYMVEPMFVLHDRPLTISAITHLSSHSKMAIVFRVRADVMTKRHLS